MKHRWLKAFGVFAVMALSVTILIWGMYYLNDQSMTQQKMRIDVLFKQIGTLTKGDPVRASGVKIGKVKDIAFDRSLNKVRVVLETDASFDIPTDSRFVLENIGLLGERQIGISLGTQGLPVLEDGAQIEGTYTYGISETMAAAGEVLDSARILMNTVHGGVDSTIATPKFRNDLRTIMDNTIRLQGRVDTLITEVDPPLKSSLNQLSIAARKANQVLDENRAPLQRTVVNAEALSEDARKLALRADSLTQRIDRLTARLENDDNTAGAMLKNRELYNELRQTLNSTDSLMLTIINKGLDVNVDIF